MTKSHKSGFVGCEYFDGEKSEYHLKGGYYILKDGIRVLLKILG